MRFDGQVVLITGAAGGMGRAITTRFQAEGARVAGVDLKATDTDLSIEGDLTAPEFCDSLGQRTIDGLGRLDVVVNNAGIITRGKITEATDADFAHTMAVNVEAPFRICRAAIPLMAARGGGAIVNVASVDGIQPGKGRVIYGMTKAAVISMTKGMAKEYGNHGIRVNALLPGFTDTKLASALKNAPGMQKYMDENLAISRMAQPDEMVGAVLYMVSDASSYFTGQGMVVDAGAII